VSDQATYAMLKHLHFHGIIVVEWRPAEHHLVDENALKKKADVNHDTRLETGSEALTSAQ
jgi:hypothetical protein